MTIHIKQDGLPASSGPVGQHQNDGTDNYFCSSEGLPIKLKSSGGGGVLELSSTPDLIKTISGAVTVGASGGLIQVYKCTSPTLDITITSNATTNSQAFTCIVIADASIDMTPGNGSIVMSDSSSITVQGDFFFTMTGLTSGKGTILGIGPPIKLFAFEMVLLGTGTSMTDSNRMFLRGTGQ